MPNQHHSTTGFLIDEDLSPELADMAIARGYTAFAVTRNFRLRGRSDHIIARYALDRELVVVTNNLVDFERIYQNKDYHPGLVFICSTRTKLRTKRYQLMMMEHVLDDIERECLLQEALEIMAFEQDGEVRFQLDRYYLPELANSEARRAS